MILVLFDDLQLVDILCDVSFGLSCNSGHGNIVISHCTSPCLSSAACQNICITTQHFSPTHPSLGGNHGYQLCVHLAIHADQRFMRKLQQLMPTTMQTVRDSPPLEKRRIE